MISSEAEGPLAFLADRRRGAWLAALAAGLVFLNAVWLGFAYDDVIIIQENEALHSWASVLSSLWKPYWPGRYAQEVGAWRPVVTLWWGAQWMVAGDSPALFHLLGVLLHAGAAGFLVLVLAELLPVTAAVLGGLVFALHPVHVEAVANVIGNAEVIAALFFLGACLLHLRSRERYGWSRALAVGALFALGALTKEIAYTLPGVLFLLDAARRDVGPGDVPRYLTARWRPYLVLAAVMIALLMARAQVLGGVAPAQTPAGGLLLRDVSRVWTVPGIWPHYVRLMLFPLDLSPEYGGIIPVEIGWGVRNLTGAAVALALLGLAWWGWRTGKPLGPSTTTRRVLGFAVVWFGITVLPAANVAFLAPVIVAERNLYIPSIGFAAAAGCLLAVLLERRRSTGLVVAAGVAGLMSLRTITRTPAWDSTDRLFTDLLERHPEVGRSWMVYGDQLFKAGHHHDARRAFSILLLLTDSDYSASIEVGARLSAMDRASGRAAEFLLKRAWKEEPDYYKAPGYLAAHYLNRGEFREGEPAARAAVLLAPDNPDMRRVLAALLSGQGRAAEAIPYRLSAIEGTGGEPWRPWVWLAEDYMTVGDTVAGLAALDSARVRAPTPDIIAEIEARAGELNLAPPADAGFQSN